MNFPKYLTGSLESQAYGTDYQLDWRTGELTIVRIDFPDTFANAEEAREVLDDLVRIRRESEAKNEHLPPLTKGIAALTRRIDNGYFASDMDFCSEEGDGE